MGSPRTVCLLAVAMSIGCAARQAEAPEPMPSSAYALPAYALPAQAPPEQQPHDSGRCWADTGYRKGAPSPICVTRVDGLAVECGTAMVFLQMRDSAARDGVTLRIVSGFRTMKEQQVLHACHKQGKCPLAAKPGYSHHQDGLALDLNAKDSGVYDWLSRNASTYGFRRTVASEPWHWERYEGAINVSAICQS